MTQVQLTPREVIAGAFVGLMRRVEKLAVGRQDKNNCPGSDRGWQFDIEGALGEKAFAKYMNLYWSGANHFQARDVGDWEVRTRPPSDRFEPDLLLQKSDADDAPYVLLIGADGAYDIIGWCYGHEGKRPEFWKERVPGRPCYFVPRKALRPVPPPASKTNSPPENP